MRAIWSGTISFGLVNIPVKLFSALENQSVYFNFYHRKDLSPIKYARICQKESAEVSYDDIIRGVNVNGKIIAIMPEDLEKANLRAVHTIDILSFADIDEIDPIYYDHPYYLAPDSNSLKAYDLLRKALSKSKRVGIAKFVLRNREHLSVLREYKGILVLEELHFPKELRDPSQLNISGLEENATEEGLAMALIDQLTKKFEPTEYQDDFTQELIKIIQKKAGGEKITITGKKPEPTEVTDLMAKLKESLSRTGKKA